MRAHLVLLLAAGAALLSGCAENPSTADDDATPAGTTAEGAAQGRSGAAPAARDGDEASAGAGLPLREVHFSGEGSSQMLLCGDLPGCLYVDDPSDVALPADGPLRRLDATLTWTPRDPTLAEVEVFLLRLDRDGAWVWDEGPNTSWRGGSPLVIGGDYADAERQSYRLHVRAAHRLPEDALHAGLAQDYAVEGTLRVASSLRPCFAGRRPLTLGLVRPRSLDP